MKRYTTILLTCGLGLLGTCQKQEPVYSQQTFSQFVTALPAASSITGTEAIPIIQGGTSRQSTAAQIAKPGGTNGQIQYNNSGVLGGRNPSGTGTTIPTTTGTLSNGNCVKIDAAGNFVDFGQPCTSISGSTPSAPSSSVQFNNSGVMGGDSGFLYGGSGGLNLSGTDVAGQANDPNDRKMLNLSGTWNVSNLNPGFTNATMVELNITANHGDAVYNASGNKNKTTFMALDTIANMTASGQRALFNTELNCWGGRSDCVIFGNQAVTYASGPIAGDEGAGWGAVWSLGQPTALELLTALDYGSGVIVRNTCNTTITPAVTGSYTAQTVAVGSTAGCTVNTWVVINREQATEGPNHEAAKITAVGAGTLTMVIRGSYNAGISVRPATELYMSGGRWPHGENRYIVNLSGTSYSTGTIAGHSGGAINGSGTT